MTTHHGRRHVQARTKVDRQREYQPAEAVALVKSLAGAKFDESIEVHVRTGLNVRHADEQLRGTIALPHGLGKDVKVAVFAQGEKAREAEEAGADVVGAQDLAKRIQEGFDDFDVAIATPDLMSVVGQLGRILGPSGKMPNPKVGTVTDDIEKAVTESKAGKNPNALSVQPQPSGDLVLLGTEGGSWKIDATLASGEEVTYDVKVKAEAPPINSLIPGTAPTAIPP